MTSSASGDYIALKALGTALALAEGLIPISGTSTASISEPFLLLTLGKFESSYYF